MPYGVIPRTSSETMERYRDLLRKNGIELPDPKQRYEGEQSDRILIVQTQGYMPVKKYDPDLKSNKAEDWGWVTGGQRDTGGQTNYVLDTAKAFAQMGRKVTILAQLFGDDPPVLKWMENVDIIRIPPNGMVSDAIESGLTRKEDLYTRLNPMSADAVAIAQLVGTQAVIGNYADGGVIGLEIAEQLRVPMMFIAHSLGFDKMVLNNTDLNDPANYHDSDLWYGHRIAAELGVLAGANYVVSNSPNEIESFANYYHINIQQHEVMPAGAADVFFEAQLNKPPEDILYSPDFKSFALRPGKYFITWGRIDANKNQAAQVRLLVELRRNFPGGPFDDVKLVIVGGNPKQPKSGELPIEEEIERLVEQYVGEGIMERGDVIRIPSQSQEVIAQLAAHAIGYLGTQMMEPFGMAPAENLALGHTITIVSKRAGISRWLSDDDSDSTRKAVLIDPTRLREAAGLIHDVVANRGRYDDMVQRGRKRAEDFRWSEIAGQQAHRLDHLRNAKVESQLEALGYALADRAYHRSASFWFGWESSVCDHLKESVSEFVSAHVKDLVYDKIAESAGNRAIISVAGLCAFPVAEYLTTSLRTHGIGARRIPSQLWGEIDGGDIANFRDKANENYVVRGAAFDLRDVDVLVADVPYEPGLYRSEAMRGDVHVYASPEGTTVDDTANVQILGCRILSASAPSTVGMNSSAFPI